MLIIEKKIYPLTFLIYVLFINHSHVPSDSGKNQIRPRLNQTLFTLHLDDTYMLCVPKLDYNHLFVVSTFLIFVIPMSIITILYILIGLQLRRSKIVHRASPSCNNVRLKVSWLRIEMKLDYYL